MATTSITHGTRTWVLNTDGDVWDRDELVTELVRDLHPRHLTPGDDGTHIVRCPDCGQTEIWTDRELADHGRCRTTDARCVCDDVVDDLDEVRLVDLIDTRRFDRRIRGAAVEALVDRLEADGWIVNVQDGEITVWEIV